MMSCVLRSYSVHDCFFARGVSRVRASCTVPRLQVRFFGFALYKDRVGEVFVSCQQAKKRGEKTGKNNGTMVSPRAPTLPVAKPTHLL